MAELAVAEAAKAKYVWLEMLSLRDLLRWCEAGHHESDQTEGDSAAVHTRLRAVVGRMNDGIDRRKKELVGCMQVGEWCWGLRWWRHSRETTMRDRFVRK